MYPVLADVNVSAGVEGSALTCAAGDRAHCVLTEPFEQVVSVTTVSTRLTPREPFTDPLRVKGEDQNT